MQPIHMGSMRRRRHCDATTGATPSAAPCRGHGSMPRALLSRPPSWVDHLCRTEQHWRSVCEACVGVCTYDVRKRGHAFYHRSRTNFEGLTPLLLRLARSKSWGERRLRNSRHLSHARSREPSIHEAVSTAHRSTPHAVNARCACRCHACHHVLICCARRASI